MKIYVKKYAAEEDEHVISRELLYSVLERDFMMLRSDLLEKREVSGKPYFRGNPIYFSISHSFPYIAIAVSEVSVGIDVQRISDISDRVMMRFPGRNADTQFEKTKIFTEYESYAKLVGSGIPLKSTVLPHVCKSFSEVEGFVLTVCVYDRDLCMLSDVAPVFEE